MVQLRSAETMWMWEENVLLFYQEELNTFQTWALGGGVGMINTPTPGHRGHSLCCLVFRCMMWFCPRWTQTILYRKGHREPGCPWVFAICSGHQVYISFVQLGHLHLQSSCCSAFPSSHTLGPSITAMDGGPVESGQDMANRNQWMDQKEKITHLYAKRLLYISCWVFWTEIGLDWGTHYWLMEDCKSDMRQHFCTRTHSYGTDVGSPGQGSNLCVWEKAWKYPLATFAAGIIVCVCAGECNLEALGFVRYHLFCSAWFFLHLIPWWHLSWWGIKEKKYGALRSNPGDGVFL